MKIKINKLNILEEAFPILFPIIRNNIKTKEAELYRDNANKKALQEYLKNNPNYKDYGTFKGEAPLAAAFGGAGVGAIGLYNDYTNDKTINEIPDDIGMAGLGAGMGLIGAGIVDIKNRISDKNTVKYNIDAARAKYGI